MGLAMFYHLTERPLEDTLRMLLAKAQAAGWRIVVRGRDTARLTALDQALWAGPASSFLAHGLAGGAHDAHQPVLLTSEAGPTQGAQCLMVVQGADFDPAEIAPLERVCVIFNGQDAGETDHARAQWMAVKTSGHEAQYWSDGSGHWEMKASTKGATGA
jgi:DNA polymerase-3 subunit chi